MPKTVKYIGTVTRWPELATTGKQSTWVPGQQEQRSDTEAAQLLATGLFSDVDATQLPEQKVVAISGVVSGAGFGFVQANGSSANVFRKLVAKIGSATRPRLLILGDSTSVGAGAGTNGAGTTGLVGSRTVNWPTRLAAMLTGYGLPATNAGIFSGQSVASDSITYSAYDPRLTVTGWAVSNIGTIGGSVWLSSTNGHTLVFNPGVTFDRFDVYTTTGTSNGDFTTDIGGGSLGTISTTAGANGFIKTTVSCTRGANTITITKSGTSPVYIVGIVPWDSTVNALEIIQGGRFGGVIANNVNSGSPWTASNAALLSAIDADVVLLEMTINDANAGTTGAAYAASLATLRAAHVAAGAEFVTLTGIPSNNAATTNGGLAAIWTALEASAASNGDMHIRYGARATYEQNNALGWMYDNVHGTSALYADKALLLAGLMRDYT